MNTYRIEIRIPSEGCPLVKGTQDSLPHAATERAREMFLAPHAEVLGDISREQSKLLSPKCVFLISRGSGLPEPAPDRRHPWNSLQKEKQNFCRMTLSL